MTAPEVPEAVPVRREPSRFSPVAIGIAGVWAVLAGLMGFSLLSGANDGVYGGDAYTGIQNAIILAVRGIAYLLWGSAVLGLVIALRRDRS